MDFEQFIISVILFSTLFANGMEICSTSAAHMPLVLSGYVIPVHWLLADFEQVFILVICFLPCLLTRYWFISCQCHRFCLLCINGMLADFEQLIVWVSLFPALLLIGHWFVQCQQHLYIRVILWYNYGSVATDFGKVKFSRRLFLIWVFYIYIIFR